jgi:hypothetical protein
VLTGYGAVAAPEVARDGADAMIRALDEMTVVAPATRAWFVETHGRARTVPLAELTRRVLDIGLTPADRRPAVGTRPAAEWVAPTAEASARTLVALSAGCSDDKLDDRLASERAQVLVEAADARARPARASSALRGDVRTRAVAGESVVRQRVDAVVCRPRAARAAGRDPAPGGHGRDAAWRRRNRRAHTARLPLTPSAAAAALRSAGPRRF